MSSGNLPVRYIKPWLSIADKVKLLISRGLQVADRKSAEAFISHVSYYRFSGYCLAFEDGRHQFCSGTTFEAVKNAYLFDAQLRDLFREATELIEVGLRSVTADSHGEKHGAFGHIDKTNFHPSFIHAKWLAKLQHETKRSSEIFVNHFRRRYREFPDLPIWASTEVMSFGALSLMISGMWKKDRQAIAAKYKLSAKQLSSVVHHFVYVRNLCAHHCRLWDRSWAIKSDIPKNPHWQSPPVSNDQLWSTLLFIRWMLSADPYLDEISTQWRDRVNNLLKSPPSSDNPSLKMGLPSSWEAHPIWKK